MRKRRKISKSKSRKSFTYHAGVHPRNNFKARPQRGGTRL